MHGKKKHDLKISPLETTKMKAAAAHDLLKKTWTPAVLTYFPSVPRSVTSEIPIAIYMPLLLVLCLSLSRED